MRSLSEKAKIPHFYFITKEQKVSYTKTKYQKKKSHNTQYKEAEISTTKKFRFGIKNHQSVNKRQKNPIFYQVLIKCLYKMYNFVEYKINEKKSCQKKQLKKRKRKV